MKMSYYVTSAAYQVATAASQPSSIALVTGAKSGIGLALALRVAQFPFIDTVLAVSRSITAADIADHHNPKLVPLAADVATDAGRQVIVNKVQELCGGPNPNNGNSRTKQLRFLIHAAGTIHPIKPVLELTPAELRAAMEVNCQGPFFLTTALHAHLQPLSESDTPSGRVLHVSSGAAHGAPPVGWGAYGITKAAFFQSFRVLERELRDSQVIVGSFKPGVVDTAMQGTIRSSSTTSMPAVQRFVNLKEGTTTVTATATAARPPPSGALDSPENVAHFAEFLLVGTTDEEFANAADDNEWDIRNAKNFPRWILPENLPKNEN